MPRTLLTFLAALIFVVGGAPQHAAALACKITTDCPSPQICDNGSCTAYAGADTKVPGDACDADGNPGTISASGMCIPNGATTSSPPTTQQAKSGQNMPVEYGVDSGYNTIMIKIMSLFAWLVGVAAITLDNAVYYTVVTMGNYINNLSAVGVTWRIMRDIGNILLIFGFLAIGISTILGTTLYGWGSKLLPKLLMAAVFLNFSLFITEAIIDTGNLFATQFYTQINGGMPAGAKDIGLSNIANATSDGIAAKIMGQLGLQTVYGDAVKQNTKIFEGANPWFIGFMGILLFTVTAFVLFSLAFMFIARFVILLFLIIVAPVGFAGWAVPKLSGIADKWWGMLTQQTIAAPLLLLLLYIALTIITDANFLIGFSGTPDWTGYITGSGGGVAGFAGMMLSFLVAMGLLLAVIMASKSLSTFGASWATKTAGKVTYGALASIGRSTIGFGSQRASEKWRNSKIGRTAVVGRLGAGILDRGAKGNFDLRGTKTFGSVGKAMSFNAGDAQKGGYRDWEKGKIKEREEYAKTLGQTKTEKERQKVAEDSKNAAEQRVKDIGFQNVRATQVLVGKHKVEMEQYVGDVEKAQKDLAKLEDDQRKGSTVTQEEIKGARDALTAARTAREQKTIEQRKEQEELKKLHEQSIEVQKKEIEERKKEVDRLKNAGKEGYAAGITWGPGKFFNRNVKAAENIRKEAKKSKSDKDLEKIKKFLEESEKPKEEKKEEPKPEAAK